MDQHPIVHLTGLIELLEKRHTELRVLINPSAASKMELVAVQHALVDAYGHMARVLKS